MTALLLIAAGGLACWALAPGKLAELGRLVLLAALIWLVYFAAKLRI